MALRSFPSLQAQSTCPAFALLSFGGQVVADARWRKRFAFERKAMTATSAAAVVQQFQPVIQQWGADLWMLRRRGTPIPRWLVRRRFRLFGMLFVRHAVMLSILCTTTFLRTLRSSGRMRGQMFQH
jgi:hypothetical protein